MTKTVNIRTDHLKIGMYVCGLDRSWLETPFSLEGVWVKSPDDIETLRLYCDNVVIDPNKSWIKLPDSDDKPARKKLNDLVHKKGTKTIEDVVDADDLPVPIEDEIGAAKKVYAEASSLLISMIADAKMDKPIAIGEAEQVVEGIMESIKRNSDALIWLSLLKKKHQYIYQHSLNVAINMLNFGRHLKLPKKQLLQVGMCGLLFDIGKIKVPEEVLNKQGKLTPGELAIVRDHVQYSLDLLSKSKGIDGQVLEAVSQHHERYDGLGYPKKLQGNQISMFGSMASITDTYDAVTSERPSGDPTSSFSAINVLYEGRGKQYHPALVERFIQCNGVYSPGSVVGLNSGELGIVIEQNKVRRLKPKILVVYSVDKQPLPEPFVLDLLTEPLNDSGEIYKIKNIVEPGEYEINQSDYYL